jgi:hypothetical protein
VAVVDLVGGSGGEEESEEDEKEHAGYDGGHVCWALVWEWGDVLAGGGTYSSGMACRRWP